MALSDLERGGDVAKALVSTSQLLLSTRTQLKNELATINAQIAEACAVDHSEANTECLSQTIQAVTPDAVTLHEAVNAYEALVAVCAQLDTAALRIGANDA